MLYQNPLPLGTQGCALPLCYNCYIDSYGSFKCHSIDKFKKFVPSRQFLAWLVDLFNVLKLSKILQHFSSVWFKVLRREQINRLRVFGLDQAEQRRVRQRRRRRGRVQVEPRLADRECRRPAQGSDRPNGLPSRHRTQGQFRPQDRERGHAGVPVAARNGCQETQGPAAQRQEKGVLS